MMCGVALLVLEKEPSSVAEGEASSVVLLVLQHEVSRDELFQCCQGMLLVFLPEESFSVVAVLPKESHSVTRECCGAVLTVYIWAWRPAHHRDCCSST